MADDKTIPEPNDAPPSQPDTLPGQQSEENDGGSDPNVITLTPAQFNARLKRQAKTVTTTLLEDLGA